ncbi:MAG: ECF transporter S component [bacterium]|nr:ECF transporter S component [bacterium]
MNPRTQKITLSAMFVALGVLFPLLFHVTGLGAVFLPMFWPVAAAGFFLPPLSCVLVGVATPGLSFLLTGMPPPPVLQVMAVELAVLAVTVSLAHSRTGMPVFGVLLLGLVTSRIVLFAAAGSLGSFLGIPPRFASFAYVAKGLPGVLVMLAIAPLLVGRLKREPVFMRRKKHA